MLVLVSLLRAHDIDSVWSISGQLKKRKVSHFRDSNATLYENMHLPVQLTVSIICGKSSGGTLLGRLNCCRFAVGQLRQAL
jgi:hypothetical protein